MKSEIKARAKINLFLHITGKNEKGLHNLESISVFADDISDIIELEHSDREEIILCGGEFQSALDKNNNIISKASRIFNLPPCKYSLIKNIPVGAGLGGGSSDAAAIIKHFNQYASIESLSDIGSDVPVCYHNEACFFEGTGEIITEVKNFPILHSVLINPRKELLTKEVFKRNTQLSPSSSIRNIDFNNDVVMLIDFLKPKRNDLTYAAISIMPEISMILQLISSQNGCLISRMSGSGATCFGIFYNKADALSAVDSIKRHAPEMWVKYSTLR